jgi:hypothetical protein
MSGTALVADAVVREGGINHYLIGLLVWAVFLVLAFLVTRFNADR